MIDLKVAVTLEIPDGFIRWNGGDNPVPGCLVCVAMRPMNFERGKPAIMSKQYRSDDIKGWNHNGNAGDIVAYRVVS